MYKDHRYINAGTIEIYRYGHKAVDRVKACLTPDEKGFYSIPADGGKYWTIGTNEGKFGEFAKYDNKFLSVNKAGFVWAKVGTEKESLFIDMCNGIIEYMNKTNQARTERLEEDDEE